MLLGLNLFGVLFPLKEVTQGVSLWEIYHKIHVRVVGPLEVKVSNVGTVAMLRKVSLDRRR